MAASGQSQPCQADAAAEMPMLSTVQGLLMGQVEMIPCSDKRCLINENFKEIQFVLHIESSPFTNSTEPWPLRDHMATMDLIVLFLKNSRALLRARNLLLGNRYHRVPHPFFSIV